MGKKNPSELPAGKSNENVIVFALTLASNRPQLWPGLEQADAQNFKLFDHFIESTDSRSFCQQLCVIL